MQVLQIIQNLLKRPYVLPALALVLGLALGLTIGWGIWPAEYVDTTPAYLRADLQEDYLRMAIDSFRVNQSPDLAFQRWLEIGPNSALLLEKIKGAPGTLDPVSIAAYEQTIQKIISSTGGAVPPSTAPETSTGSDVGKIIISVIGVLVLALAVVSIFLFLRYLFGKRGSGEPTTVMQATEINRQTEKTNFEEMGLAPPITQTMTTYLLGDDLYDESFSIDTQGGEFLGEYGVGVSETIGVGEPKRVAALEIWLFDKNDIKTATKVLMSSHAFNDSGIRTKLEPKGELVMVEPQKQIILETETLQLLATVVDLQYGQGPLPANSHFERLTLELAIWPKGG